MNEFAIEVLRGVREIRSAEHLLSELSLRSGQPEVLADMHYFLGKPGLLHRTPVLLAFRRRSQAMSGKPAPPVGALLLFEYKAAGVPLRMYTSNDRSGRRTVIAPPDDRCSIASSGAQHLLATGAHLVMLSFRGETCSGDHNGVEGRSIPGVSWVDRQRHAPDYLQLKSTFDETLAQIGKRTRTHMRYYRRRATEQLGCVFDPDLQMTEQELLAFKRRCMYPVDDRVATWRLRALKGFDEPILMGLRDGDGALLSLLAGRRLGKDAEVFWQMNRCDLAQHSLSLVMRTYLIEHEVERGMQRIYLDGGSSHSICHSFTTGNVVDLVALRHTPLSFLVRKFARKVIPWDNELAHLLVDPAHKSTRPALAVE